MSRVNFYSPLQLNDEDDDEENDDDSVRKKVSISPIKVLTDHRENIYKILNDKGIKNYLIKKMSIGLKIVCENMDTFNSIIKILKEKNLQFFTHECRDEKPFKAVIHGLEGITENEVKAELVRLGYKCTDVKKVTRNFEKYTDTLYIVYFQRATVRLHDLRKNTKSLFYTIIKWDFQRKKKYKPVQCRKCQMYGHGERGCSIKPKCATCAGRHMTADCMSPNIIRCANCNNKHKSNDPECPNLAYYLQMRHNIAMKRAPNVSQNNNRASNYPPLAKSKLNEDIPTSSVYAYARSNNHNNNNSNNYQRTNNNNNINNYNNSRNNNNNVNNKTPPNNLFSEEEMTQLTFEMVSNLRSCNSREEQFNVIARLAVKFLYSNNV